MARFFVYYLSFILLVRAAVVLTQGGNAQKDWHSEMQTLQSKLDTLVLEHKKETQTLESLRYQVADDGTGSIEVLQAEIDRLHQLSGQINQINRALEDLLAAKLRDADYASVLSELRAEMDSMRRDVHSLREELAEKSSSNRNQLTSSENAQKTLHWLQSTVSELRLEIGELSRSVNVSEQIHDQQQIDSKLALMRSDVSALQTRTEDMAAHHKQVVSELDQTKQDYKALQSEHYATSNALSALQSEVADLRLQLQLSHGLEAEVPVKRRKSRSIDSANEHRIRHKHHNQKHELHRLRKTVKTLLAEQSEWQKELQQVTIAQKTSSSNMLKIEDELKWILNKMKSSSEPASEPLSQLESDLKKVTNQIEALTLKVSGVDKIQSSTLQLFEALETLEDKCDEGIDDLKKEISKLEFNGAQVASTLQNVQEDFSKSNDQVRSLRSTLGVVQESLKVEQIRSVQLQAQQLNRTATECQAYARHHWLEARLSQVESRMNPRQQQPKTSSPIDRYHLVENYTENEASEEVKSKLTRLEQQYNQLVHNLPKDCRSKLTSSGVNVIIPGGTGEVVKVVCDQETSGGGWTIFQRRTDGKEDFNRNWSAYKSGFGSAYGDYWLGNDLLHALTSSNTTMLRVDLWDIYGQYWWAEYDHFYVNEEAKGYALDVSGFRGNASDAMAYHQNMKFSTRDNDQDLSNTNCADSYQGGWWYSHCQHVNVNGKFSLGLTWYDSQENEWIALSRVEMKLRDMRKPVEN